MKAYELLTELYQSSLDRNYRTKEKNILLKYVNSAKEKIKKYINDKFGYTPNLDNVTVSVGKLDSVYVVDENTGKIHLKEKSLGAYDPNSKHMIIDRAVFSELDDAERFYIKQAGINIDPESIVGHELLHVVQDNRGIIDRYFAKLGKNARKWIEGQAEYLTEKIFGKSNVYKKEKEIYEDFMKIIGEKEAFHGGLKKAA